MTFYEIVFNGVLVFLSYSRSNWQKTMKIMQAWECVDVLPRGNEKNKLKAVVQFNGEASTHP